MKSTVFTLLFFLCLLNIRGQNAEILVVKFEKNELSQTAKLSAVKDDEGKFCGMIRIKCTTPDDLAFSIGMNATRVPEKTEINSMDGIVSVYLPPFSRYLNIRSKSGKFNVKQFLIPEEIESNMVYEMEVSVIGNNQKLVFVCNTEGAKIYINDEEGEFFDSINRIEKTLPMDKYNYRIEAPMHYTETGEVVLSDEPIVKSINLKKAYMDINVISDYDVKLYINDQYSGEGIAKYKALFGCTLAIRAIKPSHNPIVTNMNIDESTPHDIYIDGFSPLVGDLKVTSNEKGAVIRVDGKEVGRTPTSIKGVKIGVHQLDIIKDGYELFSKKILIKENEINTIDAELRILSTEDVSIKGQYFKNAGFASFSILGFGYNVIQGNFTMDFLSFRLKNFNLTLIDAGVSDEGSLGTKIGWTIPLSKKIAIVPYIGIELNDSKPIFNITCRSDFFKGWLPIDGYLDLSNGKFGLGIRTALTFPFRIKK